MISYNAARETADAEDKRQVAICFFVVPGEEEAEMAEESRSALAEGFSYFIAPCIHDILPSDTLNLGQERERASAHSAQAGVARRNLL